MTTQESRLIISIDARNAQQRARELSRELQNITQSGDRADRQVTALGSSLRSLAGYMAGIVSVGAAISRMDAYTSLQNRLKLVTNSQQELNSAMNATFKIAQNTAQSWDSVAQVYQRFADNAKNLGISLEQTASLTDTVAKAIAVSGASTASAEAALVQFGQALASGVLRGEEFNSIAEQAPALLKAIANGLDVNIGQLRAMAAEGKLTGDVVIQSLEKAKVSVDELFGKTDFTVANSFTQLNNAVTQFIGEAGKANGAASLLSSSIKSLADNLGAIANIAVIGGVALLTKTILAQGVAIKTAISASLARRASLFAELQATTQVTATELSRTAALAQLRAMQLADAQATMARMAGMQRLAYLQATVLPLERASAQATAAHTAATAANTVAQNANNVARSRSAMLLGAVGGPIGAITIGVTALAAGYMYMKGSTEEANKKLAEQMEIASKTREELLKLQGVQKEVAINDLKTAFDEQNKRLRMLNNEFLGFIDNVGRSGKESKKVYEIFELTRKGVIGNAEALERLNKLDVFTAEQKKQGLDLTNRYTLQAVETIKAEKALGYFGIQVTKSGNAAENAATNIKANTDAMSDNEAATKGATKAQIEFYEKFNATTLESVYKTGLLSKYTKEQVDAIWELQKAKGLSAIISQDELDSLLRSVKLQQDLKDKEEALTDAKRKNTKELEKQQKILQVNAKVQANAAKYNFGGLESKYGLPKGLLSAIQMQESRGDTYRNGKLLKSPVGAAGSFQFMPATAKRFNVNVNDMASSAEGAAKYLKILLDMFSGDTNKAIMAYNAGEGNVKSGKAYGFKETRDYLEKIKGYMAGAAGFKAGDISNKDFESLVKDQAKLAEEQAKARRQLEIDVSSQVTKIREELKDKLIEIDKAEFDPSKKSELVKLYTGRAENEILITEQATKTKLDSYEDFLKTEEQLLKESYAKRKVDVITDFEFTKEQRQKAVDFLEQQQAKEIAVLRLSKEQQAFEARERFMSESEIIEERYRLEEGKILLISDIQKRTSNLEINRLSKAEDKLKSLKDAQIAINKTRAENLGFGEYLNISEKQDEQSKQSKALFDAEMALAETAERREEIWRNHQKRLTEIQRIGENARLKLNFSYGGEITDSMTSIMKSLAGEQSEGYKVMFAISKGFAVANAAIALAENVANASKIGFPYNVPMIAGAFAQGATIASLLAGVSEPTGFKTGGYTGNMGVNDVAGFVHGQEYVFDAKSTNRVGTDTLDAIRSGQPVALNGAQQQSNVNVPVTIVNQFDDGTIADSAVSSAGQKAFLNNMKRNKTEVRAILGV